MAEDACSEKLTKEEVKQVMEKVQDAYEEADIAVSFRFDHVNIYNLLRALKIARHQLVSNPNITYEQAYIYTLAFVDLLFHTNQDCGLYYGLNRFLNKIQFKKGIKWLVGQDMDSDIDSHNICFVAL